MTAESSSGPFRLLNSAVRTPDFCTGAVDLLSFYGLNSAYEALCTKPIPRVIDPGRYFKFVVGDTALWRGDGMELMQLAERPALATDADPILPLDLDSLRKAFTFREVAPVVLPEAEKGVPTECVGRKSDDKEKDGKKHKRKHKKHKDKEKDKEHKHRHRDKDKGKDKDGKGDAGGKDPAGDAADKKHHKKKRKHESDGAARNEKKSKHRHKDKDVKDKEKEKRKENDVKGVGGQDVPLAPRK